MKITFLGTSAGESYPAIWCDCPNCTYAREHGGKNIRMNTGSMIDDDILLDMNSVGFGTAARLGVSLTKVKHLLCTHPHPDHLTMEPLRWRRVVPGALEASETERTAMVSPRFTELPMMTVYGGRAVKERMDKEAPELFDPKSCMQMQYQLLRDGVTVDTGDDLVFTPVAALHGGSGFPEDTPPEEREQFTFTHSYIIERGGKTLLYALDTGGYDDAMLEIILSKKYDGVVMEGTFGLGEAEQNGHMDAKKNIAFRDLLLEKGCITKDTTFVLTHLCPHWTPPYDVYAPMMAEKGFIVAYDGMTVQI